MFLDGWRTGENLGGVGAQEMVMRIYYRKKIYFKLKIKRLTYERSQFAEGDWKAVFELSFI